MHKIMPQKLKKGDTIQFIAPSGGIKDESAILRAKEYFENMGYKVSFSKHLFNQYKYMSDTDENRLEDLHNAFSNPEINAIVCARGGYGALRIINNIDYDLIKNNPKPFCGYSDITILSLMFFKRAGLITFSGPMAKGDFGAEVKSEFTLENFFKTISENNRLEYKSEKVYKTGWEKGIIWGGNLASVVSLCGSDFIPKEDFIFFCEDLNEPAYKIDRMMTQLININEFKSNVKGIILGDFLDSGYPEQVDELMLEISQNLNVPVLGGFKISHNKDKITIPIGADAEVKENMLIIN